MRAVPLRYIVQRSFHRYLLLLALAGGGSCSSERTSVIACGFLPNFCCHHAMTPSAGMRLPKCTCQKLWNGTTGVGESLVPLGSFVVFFALLRAASPFASACRVPPAAAHLAVSRVTPTLQPERRVWRGRLSWTLRLVVRWCRSRWWRGCWWRCRWWSLDICCLVGSLCVVRGCPLTAFSFVVRHILTPTALLPSG